MSPFACLSPVKDSQCFLWSLFVQCLIVFLKTPTAMPQAGSGPISDVRIPVLLVGRHFHYQHNPRDPLPISVQLCLP
jgi:hypothetical protein